MIRLTNKNIKNLYSDLLLDSYNNASKAFFENNDFLIANIQSSTSLFTKESLKIGIPKPKELEVYALLSGISFEYKLQKRLFNIQKEISSIIPKNLKYFVHPENLGIEHCVFKWPQEKWDSDKEKQVNNLLKIYPFEPFNLEIIGVQIHPDGCVIAKGYDKSLQMNKIRSFFKKNLDFFPEKQSNWSHIPLGRILEPIGKKKYSLLKNYILQNRNKKFASTIIKDFKFIFEKRWYMEDRSLINIIKV